MAARALGRFPTDAGRSPGDGTDWSWRWWICPARVAAMKQQGLSFRNEIESGPGGKQIQLEDPDGNPIELFQPA